jgi:hypothetical protein
MKIKHTPGPWMQWEMQSGILHITGTKEPNRIICSMPDDVDLDSGEHTGPEVWANAALIAASPLMADMLNRAIFLIRNEWGYDEARAINWLLDKTGECWCCEEAPDITQNILTAISYTRSAAATPNTNQPTPS